MNNLNKLSKQALIDEVKRLQSLCEERTSLAQTDNNYRQIIELLSEAFYSVTPEGVLLDHNIEFCKILGLEPNKNHIGITLPDFWQKREDREKYLNELKENGFVKNYLVRAKSQKGEKIICQANARLIKDKDGKPIRIDGTFADITDKETALEALNENYHYYRSLLNQLREDVIVIDKEYRITDVNNTFLSTTGHHRNEVIGRYCYEISHGYNSPCDTHGVTCKLKEMFEREKPVNYIHRHKQKNGNTVWVDILLSPLTNKDGTVTHAIETVRNISDRIEMEDSLRESEEKFRKLYENSPFGIIINQIIKNDQGKPVDFIHVQANPSTGVHLGMELTDLIGTKATEIANEETAAKFIRLYGEVVRTGNSVNIEQYFSHHDRTLLVSAFHLIGDLFITNFMDITERKQAEDKLRQTQRMFTEAQRIAKIGSWEWEISTNEVSWSDAMFPVFGLEPQKPTYNLVRSLIHPDEVDRWENYLAEMLDVSKEPFNIDYRIIRPDGNIAWLHNEAEVLRNNKGKPVKMIGTTQDITDRKKADEELKESERKLKIAHQLAGLGHWDWNIKTGDVEWSEEVYNIFQLNPDKFTPQIDSILKLSPWPEDNQRDKELIERAIESKQPGDYEQKFLRPDGSIGYYYSTFQGIYDNKGNLTSMNGTVQDITERKIAEKELMEAKAKAEENDKLKTAFLQNISHEIRTPMNGIMGFANLLKESGNKKEKRTLYLDIIHKSCERMLNTIHDIIEMSKLQTEHIEISRNETDIGDIIDELYHFYKSKASEKGLDLDYMIKAPLVIITDYVKLNTILSNLINNAIKYTKKGKIEFGYQINNQFIKFFVSDTGIGVPENMRNAIFERFRRFKNDFNSEFEGSGLGLSIAKGYVELLNGEIWVESNNEGGSTFYFTIPFEKIEKSKLAIFDKNLTLDLNEYTILVVDDSEMNYTYFKEVLEPYGATILWAKNGLEALNSVKNNPEINIVLMDLKMPVMNGYEATKEIKAIKPDLIVILQTAYELGEDKSKILKQGFNDFITKPINANELTQKIDDSLRRFSSKEASNFSDKSI